LTRNVKTPNREESIDRFIEATDYPLYVVTASERDRMAGCLAGFVTQSSINPLQFLVCISKINFTYEVADKSAGLGVHLLGSDQEDVASLFGETSGDEVKKFDHIEWSRGETGVPILNDCAAWIEGLVIDRMNGGDHEAFLIAVTRGGDGVREGRFMLSDAADFQPGHPEHRT
jgi:flavin reductase (DIM6/NTAB) family NADH-FMN oxidoreductase RutF